MADVPSASPRRPHPRHDPALGLFDRVASPAERAGEILDLPDGDATLYRACFEPAESDRILEHLLHRVAWTQERIRIFGRETNLPRLTAWFGDPCAIYRYSGITVHPAPWDAPLREIKDRIERVSSVVFNSVLLNLYRDGRDGVAWHADDEPELGANPAIGSVSFGVTRRFQLKHRDDPTLRREVELTHGSYLLMAGRTQHTWLHQVPKESRPHGARVNLTFRVIR